jgi:hypothetical protein
MAVDGGMARMRTLMIWTVAAAAAALAAAPAAPAAPAPGTTKSVRVPSAAPGAKHVRETFVRVYAPLPESAGPHPRACDWITYLRFRHARGPRVASRADAVATLMPGYLGGAAYFDQLARNTIRTAAARGRFVEVWALDRRSNCLEDDHGVVAAARAKDPGLAYDYYFHGRSVDGRTFPGFREGDDVEFLREVGIEQTVRDWYTVLTRGIPSRRVRARKVICGGHSLGGRITGAFSSWDFDGDPATRRDAGFRQCAGYAGLDTRFTLDPGSGVPSPSPQTVLGLAGDAQDSPNENTTPLTPETFQLPAIFGVGAFHDPEGTDLLAELPSTPNIETAQRLLFSRNAATFATGPTIREFTLTNETVLAGIFDDNSAPLSFLRASVGFLTGGPIADKDFPTPGDGTYAIPADPDGPVYGWETYDEVGAPGHPLVRNEDGGTYTSRESEVASLRELARTQFEAPANFIEQYFPRRLSADVDALGEGDRSGGLANYRYQGQVKRPGLLIIAGDSRDNKIPDEGPPTLGDPPNDRPLSRRVILPGYNHNDVITAARRQNDGRPEPASTELARFMIKVTGRR